MDFREASLGFEMVEPLAGLTPLVQVRRVRLGDVSPGNRMRLDAIVRFLQDIANDDARDSGWSDPHGWVVRRTVVDVTRFPTYLDEVQVGTWCGGIGSHWAERRTRLESFDGDLLVDAAALWVHIDMNSMRPTAVPADVAASLAERGVTRRVPSKLLLRSGDTTTAHGSEWALRFSDFDSLGHVNNAAYWEVLEQVMSEKRQWRSGIRGVVEHVHELSPRASVPVYRDLRDDGASVLVRSGTDVHAAMWLGPRG